MKAMIFLIGIIILSGCITTPSLEVKESFCFENQMKYETIETFFIERFCIDSDGVGHEIKCTHTECFFLQEPSK